MSKYNRETVMLLLLLRPFSRVRLCATPETAAHQAPPSLGFSRQEYWSGLPLPSPTVIDRTNSQRGGGLGMRENGRKCKDQTEKLLFTTLLIIFL